MGSEPGRYIGSQKGCFRRLGREGQTPDPEVARNKPRVRLVGDLPSPLDTRAPLRFLKSRIIDDPDAVQYRPQWIEVGPGHFVAEHDPVTTVAA